MTKKSSSAKRTFLCPVDPCPESFSFKTKAYSHLRSFHAGLGPEEDKGGPLTKCPVCHKVNTNQNKGWDLKKHCIDHIDKASKMSNEKEDEAEDEDILAKAMKMIADDEDEDEAISIFTNNNEQVRVRTINKGEEDNAAELAEGEDREERQREEEEVLDQEEDLNDSDSDQDNNDEYMDLEADPAINRVIR